VIGIEVTEKVCPELLECKEYVAEETYKSVCSTKNWIHCENCRSLAIEMGLLKLPKEWQKLSSRT